MAPHIWPLPMVAEEVETGTVSARTLYMNSKLLN